VLIVDETGDRKDGDQTAHVGRQDLGHRGKTEQGVVSVGSVWADAGLYSPLAGEPSTPQQWFPLGTADPAVRTKPQLALALVAQALAQPWPVRAVVADGLYGEHHGFTRGLAQRGVPSVVALKPSHAWWAPAEAIGAVWPGAEAGGWGNAEQPGAWQAITRSSRDGHTEAWWALAGNAGPYGPQRGRRLVIATVDPATLPEAATWYLATTLPEAEADLAAVVRLYGVRHWIEQAYKPVKGALGWSPYPVRSDRAMRRPWALVQGAFAFGGWAERQTAPGAPVANREAPGPATTGRAAGEGGKDGGSQAGLAAAVALLAAGAAAGAGLAGASVRPVAVLDRVERAAPTGPVASPTRLARTRPPPPPLCRILSAGNKVPISQIHEIKLNFPTTSDTAVSAPFTGLSLRVAWGL
jgi:hypothetical protein